MHFLGITLDSATNSKKHNTFFFIGNQKTIINEKKGKVQDVHDDEYQEKIEQITQRKEKSGN